MKICDLTQFYSPFSGGVKRYVGEKARYVREQTAGDEHLLIIPGERDEMISGERSRVYTLRSPLISKTSRYRILLRLQAVEEILKKERPHLIESGDPYQLAWKAVFSGAALNIPVVGFYHSHFPEAYLRTAQKFLGATATEFAMDLSRRYVRSLYNRFERTIVPSPALGELLTQWGVHNVATTDLGVDATVFRPQPEANAMVRSELGIPLNCTLLLYVGRLAQEKNTHTLFAAFRLLTRAHPGRFHLLIVGDGLQRKELKALQAEVGGQMSEVGRGSGVPPLFDFRPPTSDLRLPSLPLSWISYCEEPARLAQLYAAADFFVHPGIQETFGLVTLEAQACGTPVIGIRGSYMDRIILSDQAHWARENSPQALATAIAETASAHPRAEHLHRAVSSQYSWPEVFRRLFALYDQVIHQFRDKS